MRSADPAAERATPTRPPRDFTFVLPDDWYRIRLDDRAARRQDVDGLVDLVTAGRPDRDSLAPQVRELVTDATEAFDVEHATEAYLSFTSLGPVPIGCSLVVHVVPPQPATAGAGEVVAGFLSAARSATEAVALEVDGRPVGRVRRTVVADVDSTHRYPTEVVQWLHVVPGTTGFVLLTFSTPLVGLATELCALFDAVGGSLQWVW